MKKLHQMMTVLAAAALAACSSMDLSEEEAVSENFPADFNSAVYANLHPILHSFEIRDYVTAYNAKLKDSLGNAVYTEMEKDENLHFIGNDSILGDTAHLHQIFVDPRLIGYTEQKWNSIWLSTSEVKTDTVWSDPVLVSCMLDPMVADSNGEKTTIEIAIVDSVTMDAEGKKYLVIYGKTDSTAESVAYEMSDSTFKLHQGSSKKDSSIVEIKQDTVVTEGRFANKDISYAKSFNMVGVPKETLYETLLAVPSDEFSISYQYAVFGWSHGWTYRPCTEEEKMHPIQSEVYPMKKYYCDDNGVAKEI